MGSQMEKGHCNSGNWLEKKVPKNRARSSPCDLCCPLGLPCPFTDNSWGLNIMSGLPRLKSCSVSSQQASPWLWAVAELLPLSEPLLPPPTRVPSQPRLILPGYRHRLFRGTPAAGVLLTPTGPAVTSCWKKHKQPRRGARTSVEAIS